MKKKRVVLLSVMIPVLALSVLVGSRQIEQGKWDKQVHKVFSYVFNDTSDDYIVLSDFIIMGNKQEDCEKEAVAYDIDGDGKKEIVVCIRQSNNMPVYGIYAFDPEMKKKPYVNAVYNISDDEMDAWRVKEDYTSLEYGIPKLKIKSGTLYFQVLDSEDKEKILNEYELIEQKDDTLIFDTHSDAGKCTVPKVVQANQ